MCQIIFEQCDKDLWDVISHNFDSLHAEFAQDLNLQNHEWDSGWGYGARNPDYAYSKMILSAYLLRYCINTIYYENWDRGFDKTSVKTVDGSNPLVGQYHRLNTGNHNDSIDLGCPDFN
ncbi:MAG: hypothetical protein IH840_03930 [Candidatus Heimdallarchaeota archaeon]|nr:hypothetical protein [Candidatus Heimdallarchaeota archaeon]